ncbi:MAG: hypothetical protein ACOYXU_08225 [Nitrospirota bacterium]
MRLLSLLILVSALSSATTSSANEPDVRGLRFDVTDGREEITQAIDATLMLRVVRVTNERVPHFGWEVQVVERTTRGRGENLLRRDTSAGGPHPSNVLAWLSHDRRYPDERILIVSGHPYEIRIRLINCRTEQIGDDASFTAGQIAISWRRLDLAGVATVRVLRATAR